MASVKNRGKAPKPYYDLNSVKLLANQKDADHNFARKALADVIKYMELKHGGKRMANYAAEDFILDELGKLDIKDYHNRVLIGKNVYDIYGKVIKDIPWYIKIGIAEDEKGKYIEICSFHPPDTDIAVQSEIVKKYEGG